MENRMDERTKQAAIKILDRMNAWADWRLDFAIKRQIAKADVKIEWNLRTNVSRRIDENRRERKASN